MTNVLVWCIMLKNQHALFFLSGAGHLSGAQQEETAYHRRCSGQVRGAVGRYAAGE